MILLSKKQRQCHHKKTQKKTGNIKVNEAKQSFLFDTPLNFEKDRELL